MQFAYQYIYRTGEESALSTYSDIYVPPAYAQQGARPTARMSSMNIFEIRIPTGRLRDEFSEDVDLDGDGVDDQTQLDQSLIAEGESPSTWINRYLPKNIKSIRILMRRATLVPFSPSTLLTSVSRIGLSIKTLHTTLETTGCWLASHHERQSSHLTMSP